MGDKDPVSSQNILTFFNAFSMSIRRQNCPLGSTTKMQLEHLKIWPGLLMRGHDAHLVLLWFMMQLHPLQINCLV